MKPYYLDYASTTPIDKRVLSEMIPYLKERYHNPSSMHLSAIANKKAINEAREKVARAIGATPKEILFTSGGTEAINFAIKGFALKHPNKKVVITTAIEHKATLKTVAFLETLGYQAIYLSADKEGFIDLEELNNHLNEDTLMVSIVYANNEIGTVQDVEAIIQMCHEKKIVVHLDAVQAFGQIPIDVKTLDVDLMTLSSHKFYGPKGVGALYVKTGIELEPIIHGGSHENNLRAGTENLSGIIGMGKAAELVIAELESIQKHYRELQADFHARMIETFPDVKLIGAPLGEKRSFNHLSYSFTGIKGHELHYQLAKLGISVSTGSACSANEITPSHVVQAIHLEEERQPCVIRITFGKYSKLKDHPQIIRLFQKAIAELKA